jgi:Flp pilus assembly protein protease CpaA
MNHPQILVRIGALFAAFLMTTVLVGGQLGLAELYATQADDMLAAKQAVQATRVAQRTDCPVAADPRS